MEQLQLGFPSSQEYLQVIPQKAKTSDSKELLEGKKESLESVKYSADTVIKDKNVGEHLARALGGIFGAAFLLSSITNVVKDFREKNKSPWVYSRIVVDFIASGALIGYALNKTILIMSIGAIVGTIILIAELLFNKKKC